MSKRLQAIFLMEPTARRLVYGPEEAAALAAFADLGAAPPPAAAPPASGPDWSAVEAVFSGWGAPRLDQAWMGRLPACRVVFHAAGTVRTLVTPALWERGIRVTSAAEINAIPVAEYTLAAIIFSLKHAWQRLHELRARGEYRRSDPAMPGAYGSTVGLLALSRTGRLVAERLRQLDVRVIAYDPVADPALARALHVELCPLETVFREAHVVSCHLPLLPSTTDLLRAGHFAAMKAGAVFINTARGGVVNEAELFEVLRRRPEIFAVLDVVQTEPLPATSPLLALPNVAITPHIAGSLGPECRRLGRFMVAEAQRYLAGEPLRGEVRPADLAFTA